MCEYFEWREQHEMIKVAYRKDTVMLISFVDQDYHGINLRHGEDAAGFDLID